MRHKDRKHGNQRSLNHQRVQTVRKILSYLTIFSLAIGVLLGIYAWHLGLFQDMGKLEAILKKSGIWGVLVFVLLQVYQCIIPIIPGNVTSLVGIYIFGFAKGFLLDYIGIYLGEVLTFLLARKYGETFVRAMMKEKTYEKYRAWMFRHEKSIHRFFIITMVLPGMPDDIICMLVGLTNMPLSFFCLHLAWTKVPSLFLYALFLDAAFRKGGDILDWLKNRIMR